MRTTLEIPDETFRRLKAEAALRGAKLKDLRALLSRMAWLSVSQWRNVHLGARCQCCDRGRVRCTVPGVMPNWRTSLPRTIPLPARDLPD